MNIALRCQNNRDCFYVHVADDDYHVVENVRFKISYVGMSVLLRACPDGAVFRDRHGKENCHEGFKHVFVSKAAHPWLPLFGAHEVSGHFDAGNTIFATLPSTCLLPWPSEYAFRYANDDDSCFALLKQRADDLRRIGQNVMKVPDHMAMLIGYNRFMKFLSDYPWVEIERDKPVRQ